MTIPEARTRTGVVSALALAALAALAANTSAADAQQVERRTIQGEKVAVFNLAGTVRAEPTTGNAVVVEITRGGADAGQLVINETRRGETNVLAIAYPGDRIVYPGLSRGTRTTQSIDDDGSWGSNMGRRDRRVTISGDGRGTEAHANLRVLVPRGQTISLHLAAGEVTVANVEGNIAVDVGAASIATENTVGMLLLDTGSGRVTVRNQRGDLALDAGSGEISMSGVQATQVLVDAGSGSISGTDLSARTVVVDAGSGAIRLARLSAEQVSLDAGSGSVDIEVGAGLRSLNIDGGSGAITVRMPATLGASIEAETGSGGVDVELPMQVRRFGRDRLSATIGDGAAMMRIDTGSGRIRIVKS